MRDRSASLSAAPRRRRARAARRLRGSSTQVAVSGRSREDVTWVRSAPPPGIPGDLEQLAV